MWETLLSSITVPLPVTGTHGPPSPSLQEGHSYICLGGGYKRLAVQKSSLASLTLGCHCHPEEDLCPMSPVSRGERVHLQVQIRERRDKRNPKTKQLSPRFGDKYLAHKVCAAEQLEVTRKERPMPISEGPDPSQEAGSRRIFQDSSRVELCPGTTAQSLQSALALGRVYK